jgi:hypothetical protein
MQDQRTIDYERGEQLGILRDARLPSVNTTDGGAVSANVLKSVLRAVDDHGRGRTCWVTQQTIAHEACISVRQAQRATWCLSEALGVLAVERQAIGRGQMKTCNFYTIVWTELVLLCPSRRLPRPVKAPHQSASTTDQSASTTDQSASTTDQSAIVAYRSAFEAQQETPHPPTSPAADRSSGLSDWRKVEEELVKTGIVDWQTPIVVARSRVTPDHVLRVLQHYRAADGVYGPGALHRRLMRCHPAIDPDKGWPNLPHHAKTDAHREQFQARRLRELVIEGRRQRMTDEEIKQLLRRELSDEFCVSRGW